VATPLTIEIEGQKRDLALPENKPMLDLVTAQLNTEYSQENIHFLTEMHELRKKALAGKALSDELERIYQKYITVGAPFQINLSSALVNNITAAKTLNTFAQAENEIQLLIKRDSVPRLIKTPQYQALKEAQDELKKLYKNYSSKAPLNKNIQFTKKILESTVKKLARAQKEINKYSKSKSDKPNKKLIAAQQKAKKLNSSLLATQLLIKHSLISQIAYLKKEADTPLLANHKIYQQEKKDVFNNLNSAIKKLDDLTKADPNLYNALDILSAIEEVEKASKALDDLAKMKSTIMAPLEKKLEDSKKTLENATRNTASSSKVSRILGNKDVLKDNLKDAQANFDKANADYLQWAPQTTQAQASLPRQSKMPTQPLPPEPLKEANLVSSVLERKPNPPITHAHEHMKISTPQSTTVHPEVDTKIIETELKKTPKP